ncbi:MAG: radical SAM protein, partial [Eubacteriaceae bacterium]|nr:radical SAM protein [Eubacteriaceae bacterium]
MKKPLIFNIQRFSVHDGGGIRTLIFFKGCPLRCPWCSNPESQKTENEIMRKETLCIKCVADDVYSCKATPDFCPTGALDFVGKEMSIDEIMDEVKRDMIFYDASGGGVTLSGGEVLLHGEFAAELLKRIKALGIDTAIETTGHGSWELLDKMTDYTDTVLFDFKIMDPKRFREVIKGDLNLILTNFDKLMKKGVNVIPRIPLIPGYTLDEENY